MRRRWLAGGLYTLGLLWALALVWRLEGHLAARDRTLFLAESQHLAVEAARGLGNAWSHRETALRRLAGEPDTRFVMLLDTSGVPTTVLGVAPLDLGRMGGPAASILELDGNPPALAFVEPVWVKGKRAGTLVWGRWSSRLVDARARERKALAAALAWWALAGAVLTSLIIGRRLPWTRAGLRGK